MNNVQQGEERRQAEEEFDRSRQELQRLAQQLESERSRLREAQQVAKIGSWELDFATGVLLWSDEMHRIFGVERNTFRASYEAFLELLSPDDRTALNRAYTKSVAERIPYSIYHRFQMKDGSFKIIHERGETFYDEERRPIRSVGTTQDVTEQKQVEEDLRKSLEMLEAVKEGTTDAIFIKDRDGQWLMINAVAARDMGMRAEEMLGRNPADYLDSEMARGIRERDLKVMETGLTTTYEETGTSAGETRIFLTTKTPYRNAAGETIGIIGIARDVTEQKRLQAKLVQSERLIAMGELVAGVAHEINNPLAAISGQAQLLQMHPDPQVKEDGRAIRMMTERAARIVRSLLTFARQSNVTLDHPPLPLRPLIEDVVEMARYPLRESDVEVVLRLAEPDIAPSVNSAQIAQVLLNLINNAEYALRQRESGRKITITTRRIEQQNKKWAILSVSDNGPGIPKNISERIFEPFFTTKPQGEGTGLGLSICHGIVEEHQGRLEVSSEVGEGATFTLVLPLTADANEISGPLRASRE